MNNNSWMNDPALKGIDPMKLSLLSKLASEAGTKGSNDMLPFFLSAMKQTNENGMNFNDSERDMLIKILMQQLSPEERGRAETILSMTSAMQKKPNTP